MLTKEIDQPLSLYFPLLNEARVHKLVTIMGLGPFTLQRIINKKI